MEVLDHLDHKVLLVKTGQKDLLVLKGLKGNQEIKDNRDKKVNKVSKESQVFQATKDPRAILGQQDLWDQQVLQGLQVKSEHKVQ